MATPVEVEILIKAKDDASRVIGDIGKAAAGLGLAVLAGASFAIKAAADEEVGMRQLAKAVENTGRSWDELRGAGKTLGQQVEENITALQRMSGVADDEMRPALSLLVAQTGSLDTAMDRLPIALDLARGGNIDLAQASKLLGKLTDENVNVFKRMGLTFNKNATELDVLTAVQAKFGGQAEEFGKTAAGQMAGLQNEFNDIVETIGFALMPVLKAAVEGIRGFLAAFSEGGGLAGVVAGIQAMMQVFGELFGVITGSAPDAGAKLKEIVGADVAGQIMGGLAMIREGFQAAFAFITQNILPIFQSQIKFLQDNWSAVAFALKVVAVTVIVPMLITLGIAVATFAAGAILALLPIIVPMVAIGTAAFTLYQIWNSNFGGIQDKTAAAVSFLKAAFDKISAVFEQIKGWLHDLVVAFENALHGDMSGIITKVLELFYGLPGKFISIGEDIMRGLGQGLGNLKTWLWNQLISSLAGMVDAAKSFLHISSPSEIYADMGDDIARGLAQGITRSTPVAVAATAAMLDSITTTAHKLTSAVGNMPAGATVQAVNGIPISLSDWAIAHPGVKFEPAAVNLPPFQSSQPQTIVTQVNLNGREIATAVGQTYTQDRRNQGLA